MIVEEISYDKLIGLHYYLEGNYTIGQRVELKFPEGV